MLTFFTQLLTPSPVLAWLLALFPCIVFIAGVAGAALKIVGSKRLAAIGFVTAIWLFLPNFYVSENHALALRAISILLWLGTLWAWVHHIWHRWPSPVWAHVWVASHLSSIMVACLVALYRAVRDSL